MAVPIDSRAGKQAPVAFLDDLRKRRERDGLAANVAEPPDDQPWMRAGGPRRAASPGQPARCSAGEDRAGLRRARSPRRRSARRKSRTGRMGSHGPGPLAGKPTWWVDDRDE